MDLCFEFVSMYNTVVSLSTRLGKEDIQCVEPFQPVSSAETVMAPALRKCSQRQRSRTSKWSDLEDYMKEKMMANIETRFSSFGDKMLSMFRDFESFNSGN